MRRFNVAYGFNGVQDFVIVEANTAEDAEKSARRIFPNAEYYYAEDIGE